MIDALKQLPDHFQKDDLEQISVNVLVDDGTTEALYLFCKRRQAFTELDVKCLSMVCGFFHRKVHMLWEQQKLRDLEQAYLQQEIMLRQSEKLATLGKLSAGMAHELNNPASVARQGTEQLRSSIGRLERAQFALGSAGLADDQYELIAGLEEEAEKRAKEPSSLDPIARSDLEQEVEDWLEQKGVEEPWEHAPSLVAMGLCAAELEDLTKSFDPDVTPLVIDYFGTRFTAHTLLQEIGQGARRITEIVKALKGYSYMDQAPVQLVDVRQGLDDTLVMLNSKLGNGINVDLDYAEDLPRVQGYGSELNQVWTNLLDNAISAMGDEGALELKAYQDGDWVVVEVADSGPGIPLETQGKIFDPFYTTKAPGEGAGLGLSISHGIVVEKHRGQISVDSQPGGTRLTVKLPIT
jgi:signal transduction histidine kinase